jgi:murein DD-endopeptidase MepM/ murein hydrolase activator NlpD
LADTQSDLPGVEVVELRLGSGTAFSLRNPQLAELTVSLDFSVVNMASSVQLPLEVVVPPQCTTQPLVVLRRIDQKKPFRYVAHYDFSWGSPQTRHADGQLYLLPFPPGRAIRVVQGAGGAFSHTGQDRCAIDFGLPEGTPVLAARDGLVVLVRDGFDRGAPDPAYKQQANLVFVRHSDGTLAEYVHLVKGGMKVKEGDTVRAGQILARSGNSGYSRGPHLHFMVFRAKDSKTRESLPIRFVAKEGSGLVLEEGQSYTASAPQHP